MASGEREGQECLCGLLGVQFLLVSFHTTVIQVLGVAPLLSFLKPQGGLPCDGEKKGVWSFSLAFR